MKDAAMDDVQGESVPLTGCQKELWLACRTALSEYAEVSIRGSFPVANAVCPDRLREAIRIVLRHTPLPGATLCADGDEPHFIVGGAENVDFRYLDLRDAADPEQAARDYAEAFLEEPVDNPLMRYALLRTGEAQSLYLVKSSHLVLDGLAFFYHTAFVADVYTELAQGRTPGPYDPFARALTNTAPTPNTPPRPASPRTWRSGNSTWNGCPKSECSGRCRAAPTCWETPGTRSTCCRRMSRGMPWNCRPDTG